MSFWKAQLLTDNSEPHWAIAPGAMILFWDKWKHMQILCDTATWPQHSKCHWLPACGAPRPWQQSALELNCRTGSCCPGCPGEDSSVTAPWAEGALGGCFSCSPSGDREGTQREPTPTPKFLQNPWALFFVTHAKCACGYICVLVCTHVCMLSRLLGPVLEFLLCFSEF